MIESHNRDVLARVAERDPDWTVRYTAVQRTKDRTVLARVAEHDPDPRVRQAAVQRLAELRGLLQSIIRLFVE